jgi:hypothetical protein
MRLSPTAQMDRKGRIDRTRSDEDIAEHVFEGIRSLRFSPWFARSAASDGYRSQDERPARAEDIRRRDRRRPDQGLTGPTELRGR